MTMITIMAFAMLTSCSTITDAGNSSGFGKKGEIEALDNYVEDFADVTQDDIAQNSLRDVFNVGHTANISVFMVESLTGSYVVDRAGNINFPLIGTVKVAGLSTLDLQKLLTEKYSSTYLQNPSIDVKIEVQELGRVVVDGAVKEPGVFEVDSIVSLSEAIALAGGVAETSNGSKVYIIRTVKGERKVTAVDLRKVRNQSGSNPQIIPNDVVFVENSTGRVLFNEFLRTLPLLNTAIIYGTR